MLKFINELVIISCGLLLFSCSEINKPKKSKSSKENQNIVSDKKDSDDKNLPTDSLPDKNKDWTCEKAQNFLSNWNSFYENVGQMTFADKSPKRANEQANEWIKTCKAIPLFEQSCLATMGKLEKVPQASVMDLSKKKVPCNELGEILLNYIKVYDVGNK